MVFCSFWYITIKDGRHPNKIVYPIPDPKDSEPAYIAKRVRHDKKDNFEPKPLPWKYKKI